MRRPRAERAAYRTAHLVLDAMGMTGGPADPAKAGALLDGRDDLPAVAGALAQMLAAVSADEAGLCVQLAERVVAAAPDGGAGDGPA